MLINGIKINLIINYKNIKHIYFRIDENNNLIVSSPLKMKENEIKKIVQEKEEEIYKLYVKQKKKNDSNKNFIYLGKEYVVKYHDSLDKVGFKDNFVYTKDDNMLEKFLLDECLKVFQGEINICRQCFNNLPEFKLKIRKMKTRWGVCNTWKKEITLNSELLKKDLELIDYVIIHEMCHFFEGNHGKKFWALVEMACPNYKEYKKRLKW